MLPEEQGERQLKQFSKFLQNHQTLLNDLICKSAVISEGIESAESIDKLKGSSKTNENLSVPPIAAKAKTIKCLQESSSIGIDYSSAVEAISTIDLISSDNKCLSKTIAVFVQLCMEVRQLCKDGNEILVNILFVDEDLCELLNKDEQEERFSIDNQTNDGHNEDQLNGISLSTTVINKISDLLDLLLQAQQFVERCFVVISEIISQFSALFSVENSNYINVDHSSLHFQTVFNYLAEAVCLIIKFDGVFSNGQLAILWPLYMNALKLAEQNLEKFNVRRESSGQKQQFDDDDVTMLKSFCLKVENLIAGNLFQNIIDSTLYPKGQFSAQALSNFSVQFQSYLRNTLNLVQKYLSNQVAASSSAGATTFSQAAVNMTSSNSKDTDVTMDALLGIIDDMVLDPSKLILKLNTMSILYHHLFGNLDQKLFGAVIENNTKFPCIILLENVIWSPEKFLNQFGSTLLAKIRGGVEKMSSSNMQRIQQQWLQTKCQRLSKDVQIYVVQAASWILKMRTEFDKSNTSKNANPSSTDPNNVKIDEFNQKTLVILQGVDFLEKLGNTINIVTNLHVHLKCPMTKQSILSLCKLIELAKMMKKTLEDSSTDIFNTTLRLTQYQLYQALLIISNSKEKFRTSGTAIYDERTVDILSAIDLAQAALAGSPNVRRILVARLALTLADPKQVFQSQQLNKICRLFVSIEQLIQLRETVRTLSSATYMYWHHNAILPIYLRQIIDGNEAADCEKMQHLIDSVIDCHYELTDQNSIGFKCSEKFAKDSTSIINEFIIAKLCGYIETRLRLDVHANLQLLPSDDVDPFDASAAAQTNEVPIHDLCRVLATKPISVITTRPVIPIDRYLSVRDHVNTYLSQMFYNLTTISMHDWRTYGQMRFLAKQKFHLDTVKDHLPTQTLEQGLDVLEIMRNIHLFVTSYLYNLNNQIFIEKNSNNKHLNTINIRHIANSLRTHGIGIINTTVNFTYQFLHKKFYIFSQYLHNEHIQSRLLKDLKSFREACSEKSEEHQMYSYERAISFNKGIRQLGVSKNGQSSLDLFRQLITHIGNAMGYVRMMRSGGIHCCANANIFLPIVNESLQFQAMCEKNQLSSETINAAKNLECDIRHLRHNYTEGTEYFRLLVDAFSPFFRNDKNPHLKLFYLIVPALILNYVEYIVAAKEKMNKKAKQHGTWFTDDGFAMGLAYVLKLLNQNAEFNSLHWFKAVRQKYVKELKQLATAKEENGGGNDSSNSNYDAKLQQTLALSEKRINIILQEFDLLYCNLNSAKIFFQ